MERIYLDYAATTPLDERVLEAMLPFLREGYGNPSSVHALGRQARLAIEESRERIAAHLGAEPSEIIFTSSGTEADNMAVQGMLCNSRSGALVTSSVEHKAILRCAEHLAQSGHVVTLLPPKSSGVVTAEQVAKAITERTILVSLMYVNNETGAITPLEAVSNVCRVHGVAFHTDAVQAAGSLHLHVDALGVDLMSLSGHKIYGPKGVGVLYVRSHLPLQPLLWGGVQERERRGGTENVAAIVGMACALDLAVSQRTSRATRMLTLRRRLEEKLRGALENRFVFNTPVSGETETAPHIVSISFPPMDGRPLDAEMLLLNLDMQGVMVSAGSACMSGALEPSHVPLGLGHDRATAAATLRFSLGKDTTPDEIDIAVVRLERILERMRYHKASKAHG